MRVQQLAGQPTANKRQIELDLAQMFSRIFGPGLNSRIQLSSVKWFIGE
jgi:hypothetical protein